MMCFTVFVLVPQSICSQSARLRRLTGPVPPHPAGHESEQQGGVPAAR